MNGVIAYNMVYYVILTLCFCVMEEFSAIIDSLVHHAHKYAK